MFALAGRAFRHYRKHGLASAARVAWTRLRPAPPVLCELSPGALPANYGKVVADVQKIEADAQYCIKIARSYVSALPGGINQLLGKALVELGPGLNFGTALILRAWGAREVAVADRFLVAFQSQYHTSLYRKIARLLKDENAQAIVDPLEDCATRGHLAEHVKAIEVPLEKLGAACPSSFDIVLSNAVLEHVYHPLLAIQSLEKISRADSIGLHQVDFRDHREFSRPLEYLLLDEFSFHTVMTDCHAECGNRIRSDEMLAMFRTCAFDEVTFTPNMWAEEGYLSDLLPRLRASRSSPYFDIEYERLRAISGRFMARKGCLLPIG